jgi:hypothetical protein
MEKDVAKQADNTHPTSIPTGYLGRINIVTTDGPTWELCARATGAPNLPTAPNMPPRRRTPKTAAIFSDSSTHDQS